MTDTTDPTTDHATNPRKQRFGWLRRYMALPTLLIIGVVVYLAFFGENSISQRIEYQHTIDSLTNRLAEEHDSLEYYRDLNSRLSHDPELMERVVREQYNMNRPHEDIFVVE